MSQTLVFEADFHLKQLVATEVSHGVRGETRNSLEIPIHPCRPIKALNWAYHQDPSPRHQEALKAIEALGDPSIYFPSDVAVSNVVTAYKLFDFDEKEVIEALKHGGMRPTREVPCLYGLFLKDSVAQYSWTIPDDQADLFLTLDELAARLHYLGTSDSLAACRVYLGTPRCPNWVPITGPYTREAKVKFLRCAYPGYFDHLVHCFNHRIEHSSDRTSRYVRQADPGIRVASDQEILGIFSLDPQPILNATLPLSRKFRDVIMAILDESGGVPWLVSGHAPDKSPVKRDHLAIIPLAETGRYQDGSIAGLALVVPNREKTPDLRQEIERLEDALPQIGPFILGEITRITPTLVEQPMSRTLASSTWDGYSHKWASVTPVAVPHMGGDSLAEDIARLCAQAGLPSVTIDVDDRSFFLGEYPPAGLIRQYDKGGSFRHAYVRLKFEHEVEGPIGLGAGRYQGYGWFRRYTGGRNGD